MVITFIIMLIKNYVGPWVAYEFHELPTFIVSNTYTINKIFN